MKGKKFGEDNALERSPRGVESLAEGRHAQGDANSAKLRGRRKVQGRLEILGACGSVSVWLLLVADREAAARGGTARHVQVDLVAAEGADDAEL